MGPGRKLFRTGLLNMKKFYITLTILLLLCSHVSAQTIITRSRVNVIIDIESIFVNKPFLITFIIDYPEPEEITVIPPLLPETLFVDKILIMPREVEQRPGTRPRPRGAEPEIQTIVEFTFISRTTGLIPLAGFSIISPENSIETAPIILNVRTEDRGQIIPTYRLTWTGAPRQTTAGERVTLTLGFQNISAAADLKPPPPSFFMPVVPRGVILSQSRLLQQEIENGIVLKLTLIPLEAGNFSLPARTIQHENVRFSIPSLQIQVLESNR